MSEVPIDADQLVGNEALSFTVRGEWAHFRRVEANRTKMTYRLPPRTTVAGMLAAIAGYERDSYYDTFAPEESAIAIGVNPDHPIRTVSMPMLQLDTRDEAMRSIQTDAGKIRLPNPDVARQRYAYEYIHEPAYDIDVWLSDTDAMNELIERLTEGRAHYAPTLGLSECLARISPASVSVGPIKSAASQESKKSSSDEGGTELARDDHGRRIRGAPSVEVDSAVPTPSALVEQPGTSVAVERSAGWMEMYEGGRRTTGWIDWRLDPRGRPLSVRAGSGSPATPLLVNGRTVIMT